MTEVSYIMKKLWQKCHTTWKHCDKIHSTWKRCDRSCIQCENIVTEVSYIHITPWKYCDRSFIHTPWKHYDRRSIQCKNIVTEVSYSMNKLWQKFHTPWTHCDRSFIRHEQIVTEVSYNMKTLWQKCHTTWKHCDRSFIRHEQIVTEVSYNMKTLWQKFHTTWKHCDRNYVHLEHIATKGWNCSLKAISPFATMCSSHLLQEAHFVCSPINPFPHTTILKQTTLNIFCQKIEKLYNWMDNLWLKVENIVSKGEIARFEQFLLLSLCFPKAFCCRHQKASIWGRGLSRQLCSRWLLLT